MRRPGGFYFDPTKVVTLEIDLPADQVPSLAPAARPKESEGSGKRVLLLEDRDDFREVIRDHLSYRGLEVIAVPSGLEGLVEIRKAVFDLIVCDMMMPRGGGEMFYWAVTRLRPAAAQRFIFFTGHRNNPTLEYFFKRVNATVLLKPFSLASLDVRINEVLRRLV